MNEKQMYSETLRSVGGTIFSLREVDDRVFLLEVARVSGGDYKPQTILVNEEGFFLINDMFQRLAKARFSPKAPLTVDEHGT